MRLVKTDILHRPGIIVFYFAEHLNFLPPQPLLLKLFFSF
jgi:hypothetical protein